jgi:hypothetical protein
VVFIRPRKLDLKPLKVYFNGPYPEDSANQDTGQSWTSGSHTKVFPETAPAFDERRYDAASVTFAGADDGGGGARQFAAVEQSFEDGT